MERKNKFRRIPLLCVLITYVFISCGDKKQEYVDLTFDKEKIPTVHDDSVTMLVSDSGIIRYRLKVKEMLNFDRAADPYWYFPKGFYVEQFDTAFQKQVTIVADTAWNYTDKRLWHLKGNVYMNNIAGDSFKTDEIFWDQKADKLYSDKYIEIIQPDKLIQRGTGFESNAKMTQYKIFKPFDSFYYVDEEGNRAEPATNDSTANQGPV